MDRESLKKLKIKPIGYSLAIISFIWAVVSFFLGRVNFSIEWYISLAVIAISLTTFIIMVDAKNTEINDLISSVKNGTAGLSAAYSQLGQLEKNKEYVRFFKQFVRYEQQVIGVQTYNYYLSSSKGESSIKIEHENGYIEDNHDINAIIQGHYTFKKRDILDLRKAIYQYKLLDNLDLLQEFFFRKVEPVFLSKMTDEDVALMSFAEQELSSALQIDMGNSFNLNKSTHSKKYLSKKRLGIAKAILAYEFFNMSTYYGFSYSGKNNLKSDRHYVSYIVESQTGEKKLYLIIFRSDQFNTEHDIMELETQIINSFKYLLKSNKLVERSEDLDDKQRSDLHAFIRKIKQNF